MPLSTLDQPVYAAKADLFRALGHPARIRILELLVEGEQPVSDLLADLGIEPSTLSQHLAVVKRIGLVESSRKGNAVTYRLADRSVGAVPGRRPHRAGRDPGPGPAGPRGARGPGSRVSRTVAAAWRSVRRAPARSRSDYAGLRRSWRGTSSPD